MFARQRLLNFPITSYFAILSPGKQCRFFAWLGVVCKQLHCRSCLAKTNFFNPPDEVWGTSNAFSHGREHLVIHVAAAVWGARGRCHDGATVWLAEFSGRLLHGDWGASNLYRDLGACYRYSLPLLFQELLPVLDDTCQVNRGLRVNSCCQEYLLPPRDTAVLQAVASLQPPPPQKQPALVARSGGKHGGSGVPCAGRCKVWTLVQVTQEFVYF